MSLLVRERPPLNLSVCVTPPGGGPSYRWGVDSKNVAYVPDDLTFATSMPGGFSTFSCTLQRNRHLPWPDEQEFSNVTVLGLGGRTVAWQGRLEQLPDVQGYQAQINPQASGWQAHLDDDDSASVVFIDRTLSSWQGPSITEQINLIGGGYGFLFNNSVVTDASGSPALTMSTQGPLPAVSSAAAIGEAWYNAGAGNKIRYVRIPSIGLENTAVSGTTGWQFFIVASSVDHGNAWDVSVSITNPSVDLTTTGSGGTPGTYQYVSVQGFWEGAAAAGTTQTTYTWFLRNLSVVGDHGLALKNGSSGTPSDDGLLASDMVAYALSKWCPKITYTTGSSGTIQPSSFVIPQAVFNTPTTSSTIIKQVVQYELLDWAVWELGSGPTAQPAFYLNQFGARGRSWRARVGPTQLQDNGPNVSRIWNGVIVQFTAVDGTAQTVGPPGSGAATTSSQLLDSDPLNPANEAGLRRWGIVQMGTSTPAAAIQVGATFLQAQKQLDSSGQASLVGHVQDSSGVWWPSWAVRAGDTITFIDSSDPTTARRIVSTSYTHSNRTNTVQLDQPPAAMDALLQRLSVVIQPIGFS